MCRPGEDAAAVAAAIEGGSVVDGYEMLAAETAELSYAELRKRERPFVLPLDPDDPEPVERAAYDAAYKGVTDVLTLYLWRKPAFYLTRWAAQAGTRRPISSPWSARCCACSPSSCSGAAIIGSASCPASSSWCSTRSTGSSPAAPAPRRNGANVFDHGIDLIHPPFWWWAWEHGLAAYGRPLDAGLRDHGAVGDHRRLCRAAHDRGHFHASRFGGMHIHVWRPIDSRFRLITARRNPNMVILVPRCSSGGPIRGWCWSPGGRSISLIFHAVRLAQASEQAARGARSSPGSRVTLDGLPARRLAARAAIRSPSSSMTDLKALIPVAGEPMVLRPLRALLASPEDRRHHRAGAGPGAICRRPARRPAHPRPATRAERSPQTMLELLAAHAGGIGRCWSRPPTMRCSTRRRSTNSAAQAEGADLAIGVVERGSAAARACRNTQRTWIGFRGGAYSGANLFAFGSPKVAAGDRAVAVGRAGSQERLAAHVARSAPRSCSARCCGCAPRRSAAAIGPQARPRDRGSRLTNPLAGVDVDKPADHMLVEAIIAGRA